MGVHKPEHKDTHGRALPHRLQAPRPPAQCSPPHLNIAHVIHKRHHGTMSDTNASAESQSAPAHVRYGSTARAPRCRARALATPQVSAGRQHDTRYLKPITAAPRGSAPRHRAKPGSVRPTECTIT